MNVIRLIFQELLGLFIDDKMLAFSTLAVVGGCWLLAHFFSDMSITVGFVLVIGCVGALLSSIIQGAKR